MIRNTVIALAAVTALGAAMASAAEAKTHVNLDIALNLGGGGIYIGPGPGPGFYDDGYITVEDECSWQLVKHRKWNASRTRKIVFYTKEYVCG